MDKKIIAGICIVAVCLIIGLTQMKSDRPAPPAEAKKAAAPAEAQPQAEKPTASAEEQPEAVPAQELSEEAAPAGSEAAEAVEASEAPEKDKAPPANMFAAITEADPARRLEYVKKLLDEALPVDARNLQDRTPLSVAIDDGRGDLELVKLLLEAGADVNLIDKEGLTPFLRAAMAAPSWPDGSHARLLELMMEHGAKIQLKSDKGMSPLALAASKAGPESLRVLIEAGAQVNAATSEGLTPLMFAALNNDDPEALKLLLAKGADPTAQNRTFGFTARDYITHSLAPKDVKRTLENLLLEAVENWDGGAAAVGQGQSLDDAFLLLCANGTPEMIEKAVTDGLDVNGLGQRLKITPLMAAITDKDNERSLAKAKTLVKLGANVSLAAQDQEGQSPLHLAAVKKDSLEMVKYLLASGAGVDPRDFRGLTPLMLAAMGPEALSPAQQREVMKALIEAGADLNRIGPNGVTALSLAAVNSPPEILEMLIEGGARVNPVDMKGRSPLMIAVWGNSPEAVSLLLAKGADPTLMDHKGLKAINHAERYDNPASEAIMELLKKTQAAQ